MGRDGGSVPADETPKATAKPIGWSSDWVCGKEAPKRFPNICFLRDHMPEYLALSQGERDAVYEAALVEKQDHLNMVRDIIEWAKEYDRVHGRRRQ
ncbi:hypothetical protein KIPB_003941 [Kipferlia bialata]|uniref:Uncharacterized protein n=1 Tax=Kipferlia bialata TaxID=797122 RepID=A0A9K3CUV5_9EUKA|nr:hypothetical protein KIPB_003941 [Kipferlia bialata]|eukprot:g3941.t1